MPSLVPRRWWKTTKGKWNDNHGATQIITSASTSMAKAEGKLIPVLNWKLIIMAFHVPAHCMSIMDLTCHLRKATNYDIKRQ